MDPFDPQRLQYRRGTMAPKASVGKPRSPRHTRGEPFLKGPVQLDWLAAAGCLPGKSLQVGVVLWFLAGLKNSQTISLPNKLLERFGVGRNAKYRALDWLEKGGLIAVERRGNRNPVVTLRRAEN